MGTGGAAVLLTDGPAVMTDDGPSAKRRRLPGLEGALAQRALCEGAGPPPWPLVLSASALPPTTGAFTRD
eukprot:COSAG01_NODE_1287_length_10887_cov_17.346924_9_plen_70_part_00